MTDTFFRDLTRNNMCAAEVVVYDLKIEREALVRDAGKYHRERLDIQSRIEPGAAQDKVLQRLHRKYPLGYARKELDAVNAAIAKAIVEVHHHKTSNLKPTPPPTRFNTGEHFNTRKSWRKLGTL